MTSILSKLADIIQQIQTRPFTEYEKNEMKNAILDRIGCGLGAQRLAFGQEISSYIQQNPCEGSSIIWGTGKRTQAHLAALINGASSSHLEYDSHDSMIPATIALGEELSSSGESILRSLKIGYYTGETLKKLLASSIEKRGLHWPAYISAFISSAACSNLLDLTREETANAIGIAATLTPSTPFESFTRGATVKDLYGGWGNMLGIQSAQLSKLGLTAPDSVFEGKRGVFRNWLEVPPDAKTLSNAFNLDDVKIMFHIKPFPCCTSAHPTLTALERLLKENPHLDPDDIEKVEVDTYRFGVDLSNESDPETPIGAKLNIPFLASSMLIYRQLLPEHSEKPWIHETKIRDLANRIHVGCKSSLDEYSSRQRTAHVLLALKNGEQFESHSKNSRWSETRPTWAEICEKFRTNVGSLFPLSQIEQIITKVDNLDQIKDICELTKLLSPE